MAYTLDNKCAKNLCKRIVLLQLIIENVVTCFFLEHGVDVQCLSLETEEMKMDQGPETSTIMQ